MQREWLREKKRKGVSGAGTCHHRFIAWWNFHRQSYGILVRKRSREYCGTFWREISMDVLSLFFRLQSSSCLETSYYGTYSNPNQLAGDWISHIRRIKKNTDVAVSFEWSMWISKNCGVCGCWHSQMLPATENLQALLRLRERMAQKGDTSESNSQTYKPFLGEGGRMGWCLTWEWWSDLFRR